MVRLVNKKIMHRATDSDALVNESADPLMLLSAPLNKVQPPPGLEFLQSPTGLGLPGQPINDWYAPPPGLELPGGRFAAKIFSDASADAADAESEDTSLGSEVGGDSTLTSRRESSVSSGSCDLAADSDTVLSNTDDLSKAIRSAAASRTTTYLQAEARALRWLAQKPSLLQKPREVTSSLPNVPKQSIQTTKLSAKANKFVPSQRKMAVPVGPLPMPVVPCQAVLVGYVCRGSLDCYSKLGCMCVNWPQENHPEFIDSQAEQDDHFDL